MSRILSNFVAGATVTGLVMLAYDQRLQAETRRLTNDLRDAALKLTLSISPPSPSTNASLQSDPDAPPRIPFKEQLKARYNEHLEDAVHFVSTTDWTDVAAQAWRSARAGVDKLTASKE